MKNRPALYLLLSANMVSQFAQGISVIAVPWYFVSVLGEEETFGWLFAGITLATLFWSLYAGTLIDRYPRKNVFLLLCTAGFLILGSVAFYGCYEREVEIWMLGLVFAATIFNFNVHYPALYAFGQEISEKEHYGQTNSLIEIQGQTTSVFAGAFATVLFPMKEGQVSPVAELLPFDVQPWEIHEIFLLDCVTYLLAMGLIALIRYKPIKEMKVDTGTIMERLKDGFDFLRSNPLLFNFGLSSFAIFVVLIVQGFYLMPMYVDNHLEEGPWLFASGEILYAFGAIAAGMGIRWVFKNSNSIAGVISLMVLTVAIMMAVAFIQLNWVFLCFCFLMGWANAGARVLRITYLFNHVPNNIIGRVNSSFNAMNILMRAGLSALFAMIFFTTGGNVTWAYFICGMLVLLFIFPLAMRYNQLVGLKEID